MQGVSSHLPHQVVAPVLAVIVAHAINEFPYIKERAGVFRIGFGYDIHRLVEGRELVLGGVRISHRSGLLGHSDADVLIHSIIDAILGALSMGDIGKHFPDTDPRYRDIKSTEMLREVMNWIKERGFSVTNVDTTIIAEEPRLAPYIEEMRAELSKELSTSPYNISIKATTNEGIGLIGKGGAIASFAVVLLSGGKNEHGNKAI